MATEDPTFNRRLTAALEHCDIEYPTYGVYDAFLSNESVDWNTHIDNGLGVIQHLECLKETFPNREVRTETSEDHSQVRTDVYWETDRGVLHEYYIKDKANPLLPWRMEYLISSKDDYNIMFRALEDGCFSIGEPEPLFAIPQEVNLPQQSRFPIISLDRTPFQKIQIDFVGLDRFAFDALDRPKELTRLIELMNHQLVQRCEALSASPIADVKLWENMSIEVFGPTSYRENLLPVYEKILPILHAQGKRLHLHYDGKMSLITDEIRSLGFDGLDSFTGAPEGDLTVRQARDAFSDMFLWVHPSLSCFDGPDSNLKEFITQARRDSKGRDYCFVLSEDVPPDANHKLALILDMLSEKIV